VVYGLFDLIPHFAGVSMGVRLATTAGCPGHVLPNLSCLPGFPTCWPLPGFLGRGVFVTCVTWRLCVCRSAGAR
jgi:hypothetical protein